MFSECDLIMLFELKYLWVNIWYINHLIRSCLGDWDHGSEFMDTDSGLSSN